MKVGELIERLKKEDPDRLVILAVDRAGNGYKPCALCWAGAYKAETAWSGEAGLESLTDEDRLGPYGEDDVIEGGVPALVLVPVH